MPYRTAPEKPVKIRIKLTADELAMAVKDYCEKHKQLVIPITHSTPSFLFNRLDLDTAVDVEYRVPDE